MTDGVRTSNMHNNTRVPSLVFFYYLGTYLLLTGYYYAVTYAMCDCWRDTPIPQFCGGEEFCNLSKEDILSFKNYA